MHLKFLGTGMSQFWELDLIVGKVYRKQSYYIIDEVGDKIRINDYRIIYFQVIE